MTDPTLGNTQPRLHFGAKAAPRLAIRAKAIIKLINAIAELVNDVDINGRIKVVRVHNYNPPAEHIILAADVSEQISMAGKRPRARRT